MALTRTDLIMVFINNCRNTIFEINQFIGIAFAKDLIDTAREKFVEMRSDEASENINVVIKSFIDA